jgi:hypothetical protein
MVLVNGNVCIVDSADGLAPPLSCADVHLFPGVYRALGVDQSRIVQWQRENGFDSSGVDRDGALLAPGYPILSRLAWTAIDPVYLGGNELPQLLEESKRASTKSNNPIVQANLDKLASLAARAHKESKILRVFG